MMITGIVRDTGLRGKDEAKALRILEQERQLIRPQKGTDYTLTAFLKKKMIDCKEFIYCRIQPSGILTFTFIFNRFSWIYAQGVA